MPLAEVTPKVMLVADDFQPEELGGVKVKEMGEEEVVV